MQRFLTIREIAEETKGRECARADRLCVIPEISAPHSYYSYYFPVGIVGILVIMITDKFYFRVSFTRESVGLFLPEGNVKSEGVPVLGYFSIMPCRRIADRMTIC
jgi:hypothetical protein